MTTVSDKPSQVNEHESQPPSFSKEWLLNFYKDDLFKPNNLNLIPYATLKSPCPPVNLMDQEQLMVCCYTFFFQFFFDQPYIHIQIVLQLSSIISRK